METKETLMGLVKVEENNLSFAKTMKKKQEIYKRIEFLNWRLLQISIKDARKKAQM